MAIKESVMVVGGDSVGKTTFLFHIAEMYPDRQFILLDFESKTEKIRMAHFPHINNVDVVPIYEWSDVESALDKAKKRLGVGDWLLIDGLDRAWDLAQEAYEDSDKKTDPWQWIKRRHNREFITFATERAKFNVAATVWAAPNADFNIERESDPEVKESLLMWKQFGFRPNGEKKNTSRFDTVLALKTRVNPRKYMVATYKDKGREYIDGDKTLWLEYEGSLWQLYKDYQAKAKEADKAVIEVA